MTEFTRFEATPPKRQSRLELVTLDGNASVEELEVIAMALEQNIEAERQGRSTSMWLRSARAQGRRLGMFDYRDRFTVEDAWRLSPRFPAGGREYQGRSGRGDSH